MHCSTASTARSIEVVRNRRPPDFWLASSLQRVRFAGLQSTLRIWPGRGIAVELSTGHMPADPRPAESRLTVDFMGVSDSWGECLFGWGKSSTPPLSSGLGPDRAPVNAVLLRQREHADAVRAGCSHSVHFAFREPCSRSFLWFRRHTDQSVVGRAYRVAVALQPLIPRGNELLNPWSSVPATLHCAHKNPRSAGIFSSDLAAPRMPVRAGFTRACSGWLTTSPRRGSRSTPDRPVSCSMSAVWWTRAKALAG